MKIIKRYKYLLSLVGLVILIIVFGLYFSIFIPYQEFHYKKNAERRVSSFCNDESLRSLSVLKYEGVTYWFGHKEGYDKRITFQSNFGKGSIPLSNIQDIYLLQNNEGHLFGFKTYGAEKIHWAGVISKECLNFVEYLEKYFDPMKISTS